MLGKYLSALRLCVVIFLFCSVDLLDDGAEEFNSEKINGDVIEFFGQNLNILVSTFTWKNMLTISYFFFMDRKVMGTRLFS